MVVDDSTLVVRGADTPAAARFGTGVLERLIISESLGAVHPRMITSTTVAIYPGHHGAPEWACGRHVDASILHFPDLGAAEWIVLVDMREGESTSTWCLTLDRQRRGLLAEILQLVIGLADQAAREGSALPARPSRQTPGASAWVFAAELAAGNGTCECCPYRLGSNLRCSVCRQWQLHRSPNPAAAEWFVLATLQNKMRFLGTSVLTSLAQAIVDSHARNPHEPLTDRFFLQLERDVLLAQRPHGLITSEAEVLLDIAARSPLDAIITIGSATRQEAANNG